MSMGTWDPADEAERNERLLDENQEAYRENECCLCGAEVGMLHGKTDEGLPICSTCESEMPEPEPCQERKSPL